MSSLTTLAAESRIAGYKYCKKWIC